MKRRARGWGFAVLLGLLAVPAAARALEADTIRTTVHWRPNMPHVVQGELVVAPEGTLIIHAGTQVFLGYGARILVQGSLQALGDPDDRILFTWFTPYQRWESIAADDPQGAFILRSCVLEGASGIDWGWVDRGMIGVRDGALTLTDCELRNGSQCAVLAVRSWLDIRDNVVHDFYDVGFSLRPGCSGTVQGNEIYDISDDGMNVDGSDLDILENVVHDVGDDGIDFDGSQGLLAGNQVWNAGDSGLTFAGEDDAPYLENNLVYGCNIGLKIKDQAVVTVFNTTVADNFFGVRVYESVPGNGGARATLINCIVWGNSVGVVVDELSQLDAGFSDIQGSEPYPGPGNILADPLFLNPDNGVYRLAPGSPCIDAGTSFFAPPEDMEGQDRWDDPDVPNTGSGAYPYYDIGADEFVPGPSETPPPVPGDAAGVRVVVGPNPFADRVHIRFGLERAGFVGGRILGADGRLLRRLFQGQLPAGWHEWTWDGRDERGRLLPAGVYFLRVEGPDGRAGSWRILRLHAGPGR
jgi:hypothetical protein